jgi:hypothetical protein
VPRRRAPGTIAHLVAIGGDDQWPAMAGAAQQDDGAHGRGVMIAGEGTRRYIARHRQPPCGMMTMSGFDNRQKGFENKYKHDEELKFKVNARRNRLLGEWAGKQLGLAGAELEAYAKSVVMADFEKPGDDDVLEKVFGDLAKKGLPVTAGVVRAEMEKLLAVAKDQIMKQS